MQDYALILHPADPLACVAVAEREAVLQAMGVVGAQLAADWYAAGPHLLDHVTFLGCSPVVRLAVTCDEGPGFCRLRLPPPLPHPIWRGSLEGSAPRCPRCRTPEATWPLPLAAWESDPAASQCTCSSCGYGAPLHRWRLREAAGFGRSFVELWGIHPGEAVPGEAFLDALAQCSGGSWCWFYAGAPSPTSLP